MATITIQQTNIKLETYQTLDGMYALCPSNRLNGKKYQNVKVTFDSHKTDCNDAPCIMDVVTISGNNPIECEIVCSKILDDGTLLLGICQDKKMEALI